MSDQTTLIDQDLEDRFFRSLFEYPELLRLTAGQLKDEHFSTIAKAKLYTILTSHWTEYEEIPSLDIVQLEAQKRLGDGEARNTAAIAARVLQLEAPSFKWILTKIDLFVKQIRLQRSLYTTASILKTGDYEQAQKNIVQAIREGGIVSSAAEDSLDLTTQDLHELAHEEHSLVAPTRIYALDDHIKGFYRGELFILMAPLNVGKSWFVVHSAVSALMSGKSVLYFTLEMSRERSMQRILQNVSATAKPYEANQVKRIEKVWDATFTKQGDAQVSTLLDLETVDRGLQVLKGRGGKLSVKSFPSGTATMNDIHHNVALFDLTFGKLPDLIIVDGLLDMKTRVSHDAMRHGLAEYTREFRAMAGEYNCSVLLTHQANREGNKVPVVGVEHVGESLGIMQIADVAVSLNQIPAEQKESKARLVVMRSRSSAKWGNVTIWQNLGLGQFCLKSENTKDAVVATPPRDLNDGNKPRPVVPIAERQSRVDEQQPRALTPLPQ